MQADHLLVVAAALFRGPRAQLLAHADEDLLGLPQPPLLHQRSVDLQEGDIGLLLLAGPLSDSASLGNQRASFDTFTRRGEGFLRGLWGGTVVVGEAVFGKTQRKGLVLHVNLIYYYRPCYAPQIRSKNIPSHQTCATSNLAVSRAIGRAVRPSNSAIHRQLSPTFVWLR